MSRNLTVLWAYLQVISSYLIQSLSATVLQCAFKLLYLHQYSCILLECDFYLFGTLTFYQRSVIDLLKREVSSSPTGFHATSGNFLECQREFRLAYGGLQCCPLSFVADAPSISFPLKHLGTKSDNFCFTSSTIVKLEVKVVRDPLDERPLTLLSHFYLKLRNYNSVKIYFAFLLRVCHLLHITDSRISLDAEVECQQQFNFQNPC